MVTVPLREVAAHAVRCFPAECCGYITDDGVVECTNAQASGVHPTVPERGAGYPVHHLVIGVDATGPTEAALFDGAFVEIARWPREVLR